MDKAVTGGVTQSRHGPVPRLCGSDDKLRRKRIMAPKQSEKSPGDDKIAQENPDTPDKPEASRGPILPGRETWRGGAAPRKDDGFAYPSGTKLKAAKQKRDAKSSG